MNTGTWLNLLVLFLAFGVPVLGAIWKKVEEQRAKRRALMERERRQLEMIRTGRDPAAEAAQARQAQLSASEQRAADRQAQLAELRRRQQERLRQAAQRRSGQTQTTSTTAPTAGRATRTQTPVPTAGGGAAEAARRRAQMAQERARQQAQQRSQQQSQRQAATDEARRREMIERARRQVEQRRQQEQADIDRQREGTLPDTPLEPIPGTGGGGFSLTAMPRGQGGTRFGRLTRKDWRRAIVMNEILSPPKSLRDPRGEPG